jgi:hypothetical protein
MGNEGGLRRLQFLKGARRLLRLGSLAFGLVQDPLPGRVHGGGAGQLGGYYSQRVYLSEAGRMGLSVRPPHVNYSGRNFGLADPGAGQKTLFMGLDQVRDLTRRTIERRSRNS